jgi:thiol-disulfide isomerase/thioredoxin
VVVIVRLVNKQGESVSGNEQPELSEGTTNEDVDQFSEGPTNDAIENKQTIVAPDFTLTSIDKELVTLSQFRGTPIVVNFWATWCPPCRDEMPLFDAYAEKHEESLVILAVNSGESAQDVEPFTVNFGNELVFLLDIENEVGNLYQVRGLPTTYFIDAEGVLQSMHIGALSEPLLRSYLEKIGIIP